LGRIGKIARHFDPDSQVVKVVRDLNPTFGNGQFATWNSNFNLCDESLQKVVGESLITGTRGIFFKPVANEVLHVSRQRAARDEEERGQTRENQQNSATVIH